VLTTGIFGVSLESSIEYAYVNISITNPQNGNQEVYGKIPIIVAKCGVYLKDKGMPTRSAD
jgi:GTPase-activating protein SAC7